MVDPLVAPAVPAVTLGSHLEDEPPLHQRLDCLPDRVLREPALAADGFDAWPTFIFATGTADQVAVDREVLVGVGGSAAYAH